MEIDYFHDYQKDPGIGSNGWEDFAQRQVARWNEIYAEAVHPVDAPQGLLDRIRIDKIVVVADGALPLNGGLPTNNPDQSDCTTDMVWGFPANLLDGSFYADHTTISDNNAFYYEGSLFHETSHARYLIDVYGFNVVGRDGPVGPDRRVLIQFDGVSLPGDRGDLRAGAPPRRAVARKRRAGRLEVTGRPRLPARALRFAR